MQEELDTCEACERRIPVECLLCRYCGAVQPGSDLGSGGSLARDWAVAGLILVIVAVTSLLVFDLEWGPSTERTGDDICETFVGRDCEP